MGYTLHQWQRLARSVCPTARAVSTSVARVCPGPYQNMQPYNLRAQQLWGDEVCRKTSRVSTSADMILHLPRDRMGVDTLELAGSKRPLGMSGPTAHLRSAQAGRAGIMLFLPFHHLHPKLLGEHTSPPSGMGAHQDPPMVLVCHQAILVAPNPGDREHPHPQKLPVRHACCPLHSSL